MSFVRNLSVRLTTRRSFSSSLHLHKKASQRLNTSPKINESVDASIATVMVQMHRTENDNIVTSLKDSVVAGEILKATPSTTAGSGDKIHDVAKGVADKFVNMEEEFQARRRGQNYSSASNDFKPLPFQTVHPSATQLADKSRATNANSEFRPLPFQTVHPSAPHAARQTLTGNARPPVQNDWLADSDDVSRVAQASTGASSNASLREEVSNLRVSGDVPHLDIAEALEDTSVDEVGRGEQKNRDYMASTPTFSSHVNHRNKSIDHDNGYGVIQAAQQEQQIATEIPTVDSKAPVPVEPAAASASSSEARGGTMEDLACVDDTFVVNENLQPSLGGFVIGEHQIAVGQTALGARFTQGDGPEVSINPGADVAMQSSRKHRPRPENLYIESRI